MKKIFDAKRLTYSFASVLLIVAIGASLAGVPIAKQAEIDQKREELRQTVRVGNSQLSEGNYRELLESFILKNSIYYLRVSQRHAVVFEFGTPSKTGFGLSSSCFEYLIPEIGTEIGSCSASSVVYVLLFRIFAVYLIVVVLVFLYLRRLDRNSTHQLVSLLKGVGVPIEADGATISNILSNVATVVEGYERNKSMEIELIRLGEFNRIADQVSHDIRSPLAVIELLVPTLAKVDQDKTAVLRGAAVRIREIVNSLKQAKPIDLVSEAGHVARESLKTSVLLLPVLEEVIAEKRVQYSDSSLNISLNFDSDYKTSVELDTAEFKRAASNLLNNAVEALPERQGTVQVEVKGTETAVVVSIRDNGKGIHESIIPHLGKRGETYGKPDGSGLGLYHAKAMVDDVGGAFDIESTVGVGTTVKLTLPLADEPFWCADHISVPATGYLVVFANDPDIQRNLSVRLKDQLYLGKMLNCSSAFEFRQVYRHIFQNDYQVTYLIEDGIGDESGFSIIEELGIHSKSILITNRINDGRALAYFSSIGLRLIPKSLVFRVPLNFCSLVAQSLDLV